MPNIADIYKNITSDKLISSKIEQNYSLEELEQLNKKQEKFISNIDYSLPENFARFGSAEEYYKTSIKYISEEYPYDGSTYEKNKWINSLTEFEYYLYLKEYPRSFGYISLAQSQELSINSHIKLKEVSDTQESYDYKKYSDFSLLKFGENEGICFQTWLNVENPSQESKIFNIQALSESNSYTINTLNILSINISSSLFYLYDNYGNFYSSSYVVPQSEWHHYSFNINTGSLQLFVDGVLTEESLISNLDFNSSDYYFTNKGLFVNNPVNLTFSSTFNQQKVYSIGSGSKINIDDTRLWNKCLTINDVGKYWFTSVDGNDENSINEPSLLFYYKFNEGWDSQFGSLCIDYSGRKNHANIINYNSTTRTYDSAINLSLLVQDLEKKDIIVSGLQYSSLVKDYYDDKIILGSEHDENNSFLLYNKFPDFILEQEEELEVKHLKQIIQIISYYFDDLYNKLKEVSEYKKIKHTNDIDNIYPFYDKILTSLGLDVTNIFNNLSTLENITSRNDKTLFDQEVQKVKNVIFQNIYSSLLYIFKSKGTEKSLKSLLRSYGLNEDLVRINLYADKSVYGVSDRSTERVVKKKSLSLTGSNSVYLSSSGIPDMNYYTLETCTNFSEKNKILSQELSLFGVTNLTNNYFVTVNAQSENKAKFSLYHQSASTIVSTATASVECNNFYDNSSWNMCLRKKPTIDTLQGTSGVYNYNIELYCINKNTTPALEVSCSIPYTSESQQIYYYIGARRENLSGSLLMSTNSKYLYCNFWSDYLDNEVIKSHNKDILNYGVNE